MLTLKALKFSAGFILRSDIEISLLVFYNYMQQDSMGISTEKKNGDQESFFLFNLCIIIF